jgi:hypothetical protein
MKLKADGALSAQKKRSLHFAPDATKDELLGIGWTLHRAQQSIFWWSADWAVMCKARGASYDSLAEILHMSRKTLQNWAYVARRFPPRERRPVSFSHHSAVCGLLPEDAARWLDTAAKEGLSVRSLASKIRVSRLDSHPIAEWRRRNPGRSSRRGPVDQEETR